MKSNREQIAEIVGKLAEYYDKNLSRSQVAMYVEDLISLQPEQLVVAVQRYRRNPQNVFFPLPAKLVELAAAVDGRPGVEEAWALLPKSESDSVVWSQEMRGAYGACRDLLEEDPIAARMAFKEVYTRLLAEARARNEPAKWEPSLGHDPAGREVVLREAVARGRLTQEHINALLPGSSVPKRLQVAGPVEMQSVNPEEILAQIKKSISGSI